MNPTRVEGQTRVMIGPEDSGIYPLFIEDVETEHGNAMVSTWLPDDEELKRLIEGQPLRLFVIGTVMPPVKLVVGDEA